MKILTLTAHPNLERSRINLPWMRALQNTAGVTVINLAEEGGSGFSFDVERHQALLLEHDRIVLQFPFFWYSAPAILKAWMEQVLTYGFAFGAGGEALKDKELVLAISTGVAEGDYHAGGQHNFSMDELLKPYQQTANLCGMTYLRPFIVHGAPAASIEAIEASVSALVAHLTDPALNPAASKAA